ncbi:hypothetical protein OHN74_12875 [Streptomyces sp. NBC_00459]
MLRPSYRNLKPRPGEHLLKPIRQLIESVNDTLKGQFDLERNGARTPAEVLARVGQRILTLTTAIWHNRQTGRNTDHPLTGRLRPLTSTSDLLIQDEEIAEALDRERFAAEARERVAEVAEAIAEGGAAAS